MEDEESQLIQNSAQSLEVMQDLIEEIQNIQKQNDRSDTAMTRVTEIVQHSSAIIENSDSTRERVLDAKLLNVGSHIIKSDVSSAETNLVSFDTDEYAKNVLKFITGDGPTLNVDWSQCSIEACCIFKCSPPTFSHMLGPLKLTAEPPKPTEKVKAQRNKKGTVAEKKILNITENSTASEEIDGGVYNHIHQCLKEAFLKNKKKPINYFQFVIDPFDFWKTIENIFHFSFLVRDDNVKMSLDEDGLPVVEPKSKETCVETEEPERRTRNQFNLRLTMAEWKEAISAFNIKTSMIKSLKKK